MRFSSAPSWSEALGDDYLCRSHRRSRHLSPFTAGTWQLIVAVGVSIAAVTVCDLRTRVLSFFLPSFNIRRVDIATRREMNAAVLVGCRKRRKQAVIYSSNNNNRWSASSLGQSFYNNNNYNQQELNVVVVVQCNNQHHREMRHHGSTSFSTIHSYGRLIVAAAVRNSYNTYLLSAVDYHFIVDVIRMFHNKKILAESFIFAYLISLDLYS